MLHSAATPEMLELFDAGTPGDIDFYSQYARLTGGTVLVLQSGIGRVAIPIGRSGIPVIGLDGHEGMVEQARRNATASGAERAVFVQGDPTHFVSDSKHPLVIIPGGGLQRILTLEEQRACLMAVRAALQLGGRLLIDLPLWHPGALPNSGSPEVRRFGRSGERMAIVRQHHRYEPARQTLQQTILCDWLDPEGRVTESHCGLFTLRMATPGETVLLLESCGFRVTAYGGFDREDLIPGANRLVIEAER